MRSILLALVLLGLNAGQAHAQARGETPKGTGDVNGDFLSDVLIPDGSGGIRVVFGAKDGLTRANGFIITGAPGGLTARTIAGDVNGDGLDDVLVAAPDAAPDDRHDAGAAYVVFGKRDTQPVDLAHLGTQGIEIDGPSSDSRISAVAGAGNADRIGNDDVLIGAPGTDRSGAAFLVTDLPERGGKVDLADDSSDIHPMYGDGNDNAGTSVAGPGDVDGDGGADLVIGARQPGFVVGAIGGNPLELPDLDDISLFGFRIHGAWASTRAVAAAGDADADGFEDFIVSRELVFGSRRHTGFAYDRPGKRALRLPLAHVVGAGDLNGDGLGDLLAPGSNQRVMVAYGTHDRSPRHFRELARGSGPVPVGDVDGDLHDDVLLTDPNGAPAVLLGARVVPIT